MKSVLITGCGKGIGLATTIVLGRAGYTVFATMRDPNSSPALTEAIERERLSTKIYAMDVNSDVSVKDTIGAIQQAHVPIDVLVNNAGIERKGSVEELPISEFRAVMETNYFGAIRCIQAVMPQMRSRRSGCIINISSVGGRLCLPPLTAYSASKYALEALSEGLAAEAKLFNIRVVIVEPGIIDTDMARRIASVPSDSHYPQGQRLAAMFSQSVPQAPPPEIVGQKILEIIESGTWKLRYPTGPDAEGYLKMRASISDEEWIDRGASAL